MSEQRLRWKKVDGIPMVPIDSSSIHGPGLVVWAWGNKSVDLKFVSGSEEINLRKDTDLTGCTEEGSPI